MPNLRKEYAKKFYFEGVSKQSKAKREREREKTTFHWLAETTL